MAMIAVKPTTYAAQFREKLLAWYDRHARTLPWRAQRGEQPDPYKIWLSEVMLQQTTVAAVIPYFLKFTEKWPSVSDLAAAAPEEVMRDWAGLGYYARARNLLACARIVQEKYGGVFPRDIDSLRRLPGIGEYTAAAIMAIAFQKPANVVDGNVERVMARIEGLRTPLPEAKPFLKQIAARYAADCTDRPGDYAQALMDLGATICTPKRTLCALCPVREDCAAYAQGIVNLLPARLAKTSKPKRSGYVYWIEDERGRVLVETRPLQGLLGGMLGLPTSPWVEGNEDSIIPPEGISQILEIASLGMDIRHSFTHFDLKLALVRGHIESGKTGAQFNWIEKGLIMPEHFPTVFRKAVRIFLKID